MESPKLFNKWLGETEASIRELFETARRASPSILLLDEIDAIGLSRSLIQNESSGGSTQSSVQQRALTSLLNEMDGIGLKKATARSHCGVDVLLIGCTNRPDRLDAALVRPGRFDKAVFFDYPTREEREALFRLYFKESFDKISLAKVKLRSRNEGTVQNEELKSLLDKTEWFSFADLKAVWKEGCLLMVQEKTIEQDLQSIVCVHHLEAALNQFPPRRKPNITNHI